ncbi:prokaryotic Cytochrome C oxidase subunit IV [Longilinea arvoryzae]|uniref:Prokaryotic Cytochrome C oxidase subunit IV n=1 Tax=Longilinea arvoryzae TaxID=360412 RepID=A0A0S7BMI7_9CHLR|nr:cytochrome C oxidase subunit IV family protein [Longilinea arvoryzae]GAP15185.1 prokaryotic Cytochrome C oxidase subunit IV [Longilinea arvoryzae]
MNSGKTSQKDPALRRGVFVFLALAGVTALEYILARMGVPSAVLWILAISKAGLVIDFFMHISRLFGTDEGGH